MKNVIEIENAVLPHACKAISKLIVAEGSLTLIKGENGSGKTTLLRCIAGLIRPQSAGRFIVCGVDIMAMNTSKNNPYDDTSVNLINKVAMVFQNPFNQLLYEDVMDEISFGTINQGMSEECAYREAMQVSQRVGISDLNTTHSSSGGHIQRIALADMVTMEKEIYLFDEVFSMQDDKGKNAIINEILALVRNKKKTVVVAIHGDDLDEYADLIFNLNGENPISENELEVVHKPENISSMEYDTKTDKKSIMSLISNVSFTRPKIEIAEYEFPGGESELGSRKSSGSVLRCENVSFSYDENDIISDFSYSFECGRLYVISGDNGAGKSTLLQLLNGLLPVQSGQIRIENCNYDQSIHGNDMKFGDLILPYEGKGKKKVAFPYEGKGKKKVVFPYESKGSKKAVFRYEEKGSKKVVFPAEVRGRRAKFQYMKEIRRRVGLVMQQPEDMFVAGTVLDEVMFASLQFGIKKDEAHKKAEKYLNLLKLVDDKWQKRPEKLSGGEKRKVAIASFIVHEPDFLLLDEPAAGLDADSISVLKNLIMDYVRNGKCVIIVDHAGLYEIKVI